MFRHTRNFCLLGLLILLWFCGGIPLQLLRAAGENPYGTNPEPLQSRQKNQEDSAMESPTSHLLPNRENDAAVTIFMTGDVMLGRGIDQILPQPSDPVLYESYVKDARDPIFGAMPSLNWNAMTLT